MSQVVSGTTWRATHGLSVGDQAMRVFVYQAFVQAGGTHMAYQVGCILKQRFGCEVLAVGARPETGMFRYPVPLPVIAEAELVALATPADLLICNPSFSDRGFGLGLPCRKLCYVQGVRTFQVLDVFFDHYVFVTGWVRDFVRRYYGIEGPVIPAFIDTGVFHADGTLPASRRRTVCAVMQRKHDPRVLETLRRVYERMSGGERLPLETIPVTDQATLARKFRESRVFLGLDVMEGFGLPMLEAMACGCAAVGWDSGGGGEYVRWGHNALVARYGDFESLARLLRTVLTDDDLADALGSCGAETGPRFSQPRFEQAWAAELRSLLAAR
jgi:hypothetical protein